MSGGLRYWACKYFKEDDDDEDDDDDERGDDEEEGGEHEHYLDRWLSKSICASLPADERERERELYNLISPWWVFKHHRSLSSWVDADPIVLVVVNLRKWALQQSLTRTSLFASVACREECPASCDEVYLPTAGEKWSCLCRWVVLTRWRSVWLLGGGGGVAVWSRPMLLLTLK